MSDLPFYVPPGYWAPGYSGMGSWTPRVGLVAHEDRSAPVDVEIRVAGVDHENRVAVVDEDTGS